MSLVQPVALEADVENEDEDTQSTSSEEDHILNESADLEYPCADHLETDSAVQPVESHGLEINADSAVQRSDINNENVPQGLGELGC